jgi:hypothetical protein
VGAERTELTNARRQIKTVFAGFRSRKDALVDHVDTLLAKLG